jgi:hypothetical protein
VASTLRAEGSRTTQPTASFAKRLGFVIAASP